VFKVRDAAYDSTIREFSITDAGIVIGGPFAGAEGVLTGALRESPEPMQPPRRGSRDRFAGRAGKPQ
jgi:circadian clock protein KaiC